MKNKSHGEEENSNVEHHEEEELELYGDDKIASFNARIPKFLILTYLLLPIWGVATLYYYWNGSRGWLDRGYWKELQIAANTTFPIQNQNLIDGQNKEEQDKR